MSLQEDNDKHQDKYNLAISDITQDLLPFHYIEMVIVQKEE